MASRSLRLLLLSITLEVFAVVFALTGGGFVAIAVGVIGLCAALVGFSARD
jgi:uncharacterized membrane protein